MTSSTGRRDALALGASVFLASPGLAIVAPLVGAIRDEYRVGNFEAGLVVAIFGVARLVADLPAGRLADRYPKRAMTVVGFSFLVVGALVSAWAPSLTSMLAGRALNGFGSAVVMTTAITWAGMIAPPGGQARLIGMIEATWMTSATLSPLIGGLVAAAWGWRATFVYCAIAALVSAALVLVLARGTREGAGAVKGGTPAPARFLASPPVLAAYAAGFTLFFNRNGVRNTVLPLFAASVIGLDPAGIGLVVAVVAGVTVLATVTGGHLADRWGRRPVLLAGFVLLVLGNLALAASASQATLLVAAVVLGLGGLNSSVPAAVIAGSVPAAQLGGAVGGYRFLQDAGFVSGPLVLGLVLDWAGYQTGLLVASGAVLAGLVLVAHLLRRAGPEPSPQPAA